MGLAHPGVGGQGGRPFGPRGAAPALVEVLGDKTIWTLLPHIPRCALFGASPLRVTLRVARARAHEGNGHPQASTCRPPQRGRERGGIKHSNMNTPSLEEVQVAFNGSMILGFSSSHYISHFAAVFIVARTKISIA